MSAEFLKCILNSPLYLSAVAIPFVVTGVFAKPILYAIYGLFDLWLGLWVLILKVASRFRSRIKITDTALLPGICWSTDLHYSGQMADARYFRDCDNARQDFGFRCGLTDYIFSVKGGMALVQASTIRFRKPMKFLQRYTITTRIFAYDEKAVYLEHCFVTKDEKTNSDFVNAITLFKCPLKNINVKNMMKEVFKVDEVYLDVNEMCLNDPEKEQELKLFIQMNEVSSTRLRVPLSAN